MCVFDTVTHNFVSTAYACSVSKGYLNTQPPPDRIFFWWSSIFILTELVDFFTILLESGIIYYRKQETYTGGQASSLQG